MTQIVRSLLHKHKASTSILRTHPKSRVQQGEPVIPRLGSHRQEDPRGLADHVAPAEVVSSRFRKKPCSRTRVERKTQDPCFGHSQEIHVHTCGYVCTHTRVIKLYLYLPHWHARWNSLKYISSGGNV